MRITIEGAGSLVEPGVGRVHIYEDTARDGGLKIKFNMRARLGGCDGEVIAAEFHNKHGSYAVSLDDIDAVLRGSAPLADPVETFVVEKAKIADLAERAIPFLHIVRALASNAAVAKEAGDLLFEIETALS